MNYLTAENLTKIYGEKILFTDLNISINRGQKVALIAKNGAGKSSLIRILSGEDSSDGDGKVLIHKTVKIGYLHQEPDLNENDTILEAVLNSDNPTIAAIKHYEACLLQQDLYGTNETEKALEKAMEKMHLLNAWDYESRIKEILTRFNVHKLDQSISVLSGGERKRVAMASVLIQEPDLLIMDEPTNHIDLEMIEWLENYLAKQKNLAIFLVTHDRYFLDRVTDEILELERGQILKYRGNYTYYLTKKAELETNLVVEVEKARKLMKKELVWIRAQPKARTTKNKARVDSFDGIVSKAHTNIAEDTMGFQGIRMERIGSRTIELHYINKNFDLADGGKLPILKDFNYTFNRRDRVGIVGKNGAGKTTFLKMLVGEERIDSGKMLVGGTVKFGYYTQSGLSFKPGKKVIDVVRDVAEYLPMEKGKSMSAGQLLFRFQFPYHMHTAYVETLSGGERRRLYLLTILMQNPNFLILDEPTNDLDILTLNVLEEFLLQFKGCLVIVSHDRYFMDKLVDHLFVFEGEGKVRDFPGNYTQYRNKKQIEDKESKEAQKAVKAETKPSSSKKHSNNKSNKDRKRLSYNEKREFERLEQEIDDMETEKADLEAKLSTGTVEYDEMMKYSMRIGELLKDIETKSDRWLELSEFA